MSNVNEPNPNPYAPPAEYDIDNENVPAVEIRKAHVAHEASVRSLGCLYYFGSMFLLVAGLAALLGVGVRALQTNDSGAVFIFALGAIYILLGGLYFWIGSGLRSLNRVGRIGATVFAVIGLLGIPVGTLISAYFLYLLWSKKGARVFSDDYKKIIELTPEVKHKTSLVAWIALVLVIGLVAMVVVLALTGN